MVLKGSGSFFFVWNALLIYCQTQSYKQKEMGNKKENISEERLSYVVVIK